MYIRMPTSYPSFGADLSNDDLARMFLPGLVGDLELLALDGQRRVPVGLLREHGHVPFSAQHLRLVSTRDELRGFSVVKSPGAKRSNLSFEASFDIASSSGDLAMVFVTRPDINIMDVLNFFTGTFSVDKDRYRIALDLPLPNNEWHVTDESTNRLMSEGCKIFDVADLTLRDMTIH